jgi:hypothetical protein
VAGVAALLLTQGAFHAGALRLSLPTLTVAQPLVAIAISLVFFGEHIATSAAAIGCEVVGLALITGGVFAIAQTPQIAGLDAISSDHSRVDAAGGRVTGDPQAH